MIEKMLETENITKKMMLEIDYNIMVIQLENSLIVSSVKHLVLVQGKTGFACMP